MLQNPELHYLDNAATTMVAPEVADVIDKAMREHWANPSSLYGPGARSEEALNAARAAVARTLGCKPKELYFTSCGSEINTSGQTIVMVTHSVRAASCASRVLFLRDGEVSLELKRGKDTDSQFYQRITDALTQQQTGGECA